MYLHFLKSGKVGSCIFGWLSAGQTSKDSVVDCQSPQTKFWVFVLKKYTAFIHNCILKGPTKLIKESDIILNIRFRIEKGNKILKTKMEK